MMIVLASVGGALAFKAHSAYSGGNIYGKVPTATNCTVRITTLTTTFIAAEFEVDNATFGAPGPCGNNILAKEVQ